MFFNMFNHISKPLWAHAPRVDKRETWGKSWSTKPPSGARVADGVSTLLFTTEFQVKPGWTGL